jgi:hypothetical protein
MPREGAAALRAGVFVILVLALASFTTLVPANGASDPVAAPAYATACGGLCGDLNLSGAVTSADVISLIKSVSYAYLQTSVPECADVDDYQGVNLRDEAAMAKKVFASGPDLDCAPDQPPYVPQPSNDFVVAMNGIVPADSAVVRIYPEFRAASEFHSFSADFRFDVEGEIPRVIVHVTSTPFEAGWEGQYVQVPGQADDSAGVIMLAFHDLDGNTGPPADYPLGWFDIRVAPAPYPRRINFTLEGYFYGHPPGFNTPMMMDTQLVGWEITPVYYSVKTTGDVNFDGDLTSADIIGLVNYVFKSGGVPYPVPATGDVNCNASVTSADVIHLVNFVFKSGAAPCDVESECIINLDEWTCP